MSELLRVLNRRVSVGVVIVACFVDIASVALVRDNSLEDIGNLANLVTAIAAIAAVLVAWTQIEKSRNQQIEAVARDHYQNFLRLCLEYPEFTMPSEHDIDFDKKTYDGCPLKFRQYDWFFWNGMNALESLLFSIGDRESWQTTIASILDDHKGMLGSELVGGYADTFEPKFRAFLSPWLLSNARKARDS